MKKKILFILVLLLSIILPNNAFALNKDPEFDSWHFKTII